MFTVITAASAKMGWWKSKANHSQAVQLPEVLRPSGLIGSAGSGRHAAFPRGRLEMLQNYQLGLKACTLWSVQRRVGPTENVKPSPCYGVQSTELHPCDESRTAAVHCPQVRRIYCVGCMKPPTVWAGRCARCSGEDRDTLGCHASIFPSRRVASGKGRLEAEGP